MSRKPWPVFTFFVAVIVLTLVVPWVQAQTPPAGTQQAEEVVQETVATHAQGNTVVTERTFIGGNLVKVEITVMNPQGEQIGKVQIAYDPVTRQVTKREATVTHGAALVSLQELLNTLGISDLPLPPDQAVPVKVEEELRNGQVVKREVEFIQNGVKIKREFKLVNGQLTPVEEEREVLDEDENDEDHGPGVSNQGSGSSRESDEDRHNQDEREDEDHEEEDD